MKFRRSGGALLALALLLTGGAAGAQRAPAWHGSIEDRDPTLGWAAVNGNLSFVAGSELADVLNDFERGLIAALDSRSGDLLWVKEGDTATGKDGPRTGFSFLGPLALSKGVVVAGGARQLAGPTPDAPTVEGVVRAYDQKTGALLWSKRIDGGNTTLVAASGGIAFAGTTVGTSEEPSIQLNAYDLLSGSPLWDETYGADENARLAALVTTGRSVALVASQDGPGMRDIAVQAYDAKTGGFLFGDVYDDGDSEVAHVAVARGRRLFVGGSRTDASMEQDDLLLAWDLGKRTRIWDHSLAKDGNQSSVALAASGSALFALTLGQGDDLVLRAHDGRTGVVRWDEDLNVFVTFSPDSVAAKGRRVVVAVDSGVFAFDSRSGAPAWDSMTGGLDGAIGGKWVVVPGFGGADGYLAR